MNTTSPLLRPTTPLAVRLEADVAYGRGGVAYTSKQPRSRPLLMDVREPIAGAGLRPAIVMAFGGAFHRGSKENDALQDGGNTSTAWYADYWASQGFVTASIDYRLVQEDPEPGSTVAVADIASIGASRMQAVRALLGLEPATPEALWRGVEAASDDMAAAARFMQRNASRWRIDPARIALWGWSAGARIALNAAFAEGFPARALIACSAYSDLLDLDRLVPDRQSTPATLLVTAERDLPHIRDQAPGIAALLRQRLQHVQCATVMDAGHFYGADATVRTAAGTSRPLLAAMTDFLNAQLRAAC